MELTELQKKTKDHVLEVFKTKKCYLIADEVGLGKTIIAGEVIRKLADAKQENGLFVVYYICGNERVTSQNCRKLRENYNGIESKDVRLSMQWEYYEEYQKEKGILFLPLTPATTFTHKNSEFNTEEFGSQNRFVEKYPAKKGIFAEIEKKCAEGCKAGAYTKETERTKCFTRKRELILQETMSSILKPDLVLLDEFQNYSDLLYQDYPVFKKCIEKAEHVLLLSATPYEMNSSEVRSMSPFDDGLGLKDDKLKDNEEEQEELFFKEGKNESFDQMERFIANLNNIEQESKGDGETKIPTSDYLYDNVLCRSERSMFYNIDKESEVEYVYSDIEREMNHLEYTSELYMLYRDAYTKLSGGNKKYFPGESGPSDAFVSYVKECPAPAKFATRYKSLKNQKSDTNYFSVLKDTGVFSDKVQGRKMDSFKHGSLSLLREQACPEGIEKLLWIPPVVLDVQDTSEKNPFPKLKNYTKSLVFGNYRLSTAAPSCLLSEWITEKQMDLIRNAELPSLEEKDIIFSDAEWWPFGENGNDGYKQALNALREMIKQYLLQNLDLIRAVTGVKEANEVQCAVNTYAKWGDLKSVITEYVFLLGISENGKAKKLDETKKMLNKMAEYFFNKGKSVKEMLCPTKVICFTDTIQYEGQLDDDKLRTACQRECGFAERFTEDNTDRNAHSKEHQKNLQNLFNSPFYPFVLSSTSVAQEGLDFHNYCHRIVHWSVAKTPISYEQREGRIDRYLSHLVRKRIALCGRGDSFEKRLRCIKEKSKEIEDVKGKKPLFPYWYLGKEEFCVVQGRQQLPDEWPYFIRVICALPNSRESRYFAQLRAALKNYNYYIGPTYQEQGKTDRNLCPLFRE